MCSPPQLKATFSIVFVGNRMGRVVVLSEKTPKGQANSDWIE
jgi:hypothetical protein